MLVYILEIVAQYRLNLYGIQCHQFTVNVQYFIPITLCAYDSVLPSKRHRSVDKDSGFTSYIERFNCTIRQRVSRVGKKELSLL
ncbi:MAG: hypothetical protein EAZ94_12580 [Oscillatoriales cyanobacterium]|nr:MAG: hypothetical protein EAZ94_12580 [Oscillatoriales cyanobacterium]